jgi:hypothetical protein
MKPSTILKKAKAKIATPGKWHQGYYRSKERAAYCAMGAINLVMTGCSEEWPTSKRAAFAEDCLDAAVGFFGEDPGMVRFNDHPETTHADVMEVYDIAIELAKGAGE